MSGCTQTGKPLVAILMAVYEPRMDWLREQLESLEAQTYPNLRLYIRDDCSPTVSFEEIQQCVMKCIKSISYDIKRNEKNLGSNGTFEQLTCEAEGEYFAYCDQDDVWLPEKIAALEDVMGADVTMAYCDMEVIGESGERIANSLREIRPRLRYVQGKDLAETYFFRNCTAGCCMLICSSIAKKAMPFPEETVCDHWLAVIAASAGRIHFTDKALQRYRQHSRNQTGILQEVADAGSYSEKRVKPLRKRLEHFRAYADPSEELVHFVEARLGRNVPGIWAGRRYSPYEAAFEILMGSGLLTPKRAAWCLKKIKGKAL